jgi:hypothetical protein
MIFDNTYEYWTQLWWKWLMSVPKANSPAIDKSGKNSNVNQNNPNVYFLAGEMEGKAKRKVDIPAGKAILLLLIGHEFSPAEVIGILPRTSLVTYMETNPGVAPKLAPQQLSKLKDFAREHVDYMYSLDAVIDEGTDKELRLHTGQLCQFRVASTFSVDFVSNNVFDTLDGITPVAADGYYLFIRENTFKKDEDHTLWFSAVAPGYSTEVSFSIHIS